MKTHALLSSVAAAFVLVAATAIAGCSTGTDNTSTGNSALNGNEQQPDPGQQDPGTKPSANDPDACFAACVASDPEATAVDQKYHQCADSLDPQTNTNALSQCVDQFWSDVGAADQDTQALLNSCGNQCFGGGNGNGGNTQQPPNGQNNGGGNRFGNAGNAGRGR